MKKVFGLVLLVALLVVHPLKGFPQNETSEAVEALAPSPLLKNVIYVRLKSQFNGIDYYKGVKNPRDIEIKEYNLDRVEIRLKEDTIPLDKDTVRALYSRSLELLKKAGLRVLNIHQQDKKQTTLVPTLSLDIDAIATSDSNFVVLVDLSLSKWISTWAGTENLQAQVIVWRHKVLLTAKQDVLVGSLEEATDEVLNEFLAQIALANPTPRTPETEEKSENKEG